jgi:hypothetical protein
MSIRYTGRAMDLANLRSLGMRYDPTIRSTVETDQ